MVKNYGQAWETWRKLAEEWIINQDAGASNKLEALAIFFEVYLIGSVPFTSDVISFFIGKNNWQASIEEFKRIMLEKTNKGDNSHTAKLLNYATNFIDWVLATHFSQKSDNGKLICLYTNPFEKERWIRKFEQHL